jgi:hypothetical protein
MEKEIKLILEKLERSRWIDYQHYIRSESDRMHLMQKIERYEIGDAFNALTALFKAKMLEIIGDNKTLNPVYTNKTEDFTTYQSYEIGYNQAKAELRKKVEGV